ncbi:AvrD family protein [Actinokineospora soli]
MTNQTLQRATVDDYLGDGARRFFSAGYRRVDYTFGAVSVSVPGAGHATVATTVGLGYPGDWSKKAAGVDLRPHLSTIDAILLGVQLAEMCLVAAFRPDPAAHRAMWVRRVKIRAGQRPEEDLGELPLGGRLRATERVGDEFVSTVDCQVGAMRVRCEVVHTGVAIHTGRTTLSDPDALLGPADQRYYGTGFARATHRIDDLAVDGVRASGTVRLQQSDADQGIEGAYAPAVTMVDAFATGLQLAQILLYELDGMRRADSNTLWMRSTTLDVRDPRRPADGPLALTTGLDNSELIAMDGGRWRTADVVTDLAGTTFTCAVAHALPTAE